MSLKSTFIFSVAGALLLTPLLTCGCEIVHELFHSLGIGLPQGVFLLLVLGILL